MGFLVWIYLVFEKMRERNSSRSLSTAKTHDGSLLAEESPTHLQTKISMGRLTGYQHTKVFILDTIQPVKLMKLTA
jgi:hypothetical protein